jgi:hypothetical protein
VKTVRLGFRAFDPHELLAHFVAERAGLYRQAELAVELVDLRASESPHDASCACGAALFQALEGAPVEILLIASAAPLFWLYGRGGGRDAEGDCSRIATYPSGAPPARFLELALDGRATFVSAPDDTARLALVAEGVANCVLLSSATPPARVPGGLVPLFCLADRVLVPSTGVAAPHEHDPAVDRLVEAHRHALARLACDLPLGKETVRSAFRFSDEEAAWTLEQTACHFTPDGRVPAVKIDAALRAVGASRSPYAAGAISYSTSNQEDHR